MPDPEVKIKITADAQDAAAALQQTQQQLEELNSSTPSGAPPDGNPAELEARLTALSEAAGKHAEQTQKQVDAAQNLADSVLRANEAVKESTSLTAALEKALGGSVEKYDELGVLTGTLASRYEELNARANDLLDRLDKEPQALAEIAAEAKAAESAMARYAQAQKELEIRLKNAAGAQESITAIRQLGNAQQELSFQLQATATSARGMAQSLQGGIAARAQELASLDASAAGYKKIAAEQARMTATDSQLASQFTRTANAADAQLVKLDDLNKAYAAGQLAGEQYYAALESINAASDKAADAQAALTARAEALATMRAASAGAAEKEAQQSALLAEQARLETLTKAQLTAELQRLADARRAAAASGDAAAYAAATASYTQANKALRGLTREQQIGKMATVQQAQAGLQLTQSIESLIGQAKSGQVSLAGFATQITAIGFAIKAGLGPIGWAVAGIQALCAALDYFDINPFTNKLKDLEEEGKQLNKEHDEMVQAFEKSAQNLEKIREGERARIVASMEQELTAAREEKLQAVKQAADADAARASQAAADEQRQLAAAKNTLEIEKQRLAQAVSSGELSANAAQKQQEAAEAAFRETERQIEREAALRANKLAAADAARLERAAQEMQDDLKEKIAPFQDLLEVKMPSPQEWEHLQLKIQESVEEAGDRSESARVRALMASIRETLAEAGVNIGAGDEAVLEWVQALQELNKEQQDAIQSVREQAATARQTAVATKETYQKTLETQEQEARLTAAKAAAAAAAEEQQKRQEDYAKLEDKSNDEKLGYVHRVLSSLKQGSEEYAKWAKEANKLTTANLAKQLDDIKNNYKTQGSYARALATTEAQQLTADRQALQARRAALRNLLAAPGLDAKTQEAINKALADTNKELQGYKKTAAAAARQAQRNLLSAQAPDLKATNKSFEGNLKRWQKSYEMQAQKLEAAARKGDTKGMVRAQNAERRLVRAMESATGNTGQYAKAMQQLFDDSEKVYQSGDNRTVRKKQEDAIKRLTQQSNRRAGAAKRSADAEEKDARRAGQKSANKGDKEVENAQTRRAREIDRETNQSRRTTKRQGGAAQQGADASALQAQIASLQAQLDTATSALTSQANALQQLQPAISQLGAIASQGATAAAAAVAAVRQEITNLREAVNRLKNR